MPTWIVNFFEQGSEHLEDLRLFGFEHCLVLFLTVAGALTLWRFREKLARFSHHRALCRGIAILFLVNMAIFYGVFIVQGVYDWHIHLPLHLCFLTNFAMVYVLLTQNKKAFRIVYFFTWVGPLPAMLMPNTPMRFDRFQTIHFVISHHLLLLTGLYALFVLGWQIQKKDILRAFLAGNILFAFIFVFNYFCGTNYIMTTRLPEHILALFPILRYLNYPILWLEICGILGMCAAWLPAKKLQNTPKLRAPATVGETL